MKERLKILRMQAGLTQVDVAERMGYESQSTICMWETGDRNPPVTILPKLAELYGCEVGDFFKTE